MKNHIKDTLIDLALKTRDYEWINEILASNYDMTPITKEEQRPMKVDHRLIDSSFVTVKL